MPYAIEPIADKFQVVDGDGNAVGDPHNTRKQATAHLRALYANSLKATSVSDAKEGGKMNESQPNKSTKDERSLIDRFVNWVANSKEESINKFQERIYTAFNTKFTPQQQVAVDPIPSWWIAEIYRDYIVASWGDKYYKIPFSPSEDGSIIFADRSEWKEVSRDDRWIEKEIKMKEGRRNANTDLDRLQQIHDLSVMNGAACPMIYKEASGQYRWITISTNSYQDRDGEILSQAALEADLARSDDAQAHGPLRWWHMGSPDTATKEAGPGVDIGVCDFRALHGRMLIESGTFTNEAIAAALKERAADLSVSVGFFHPFTEPDQNGVYHNIHTFERSLLPRGKESNQLTALTVKGESNDMPTLKEKWSEFVGLVGEQAAQSAVTAAEQTDKQAQESGLKFKEEAEPVKPEGEATAEATPEAEAAPAEDEMTEKEISRTLKALKPHIESMIKSYLEAGSKEQTDKEAGVTAALAEMKASQEAIVSAVKELQGDLPRSVAAGFRASQSEATILNKETLKEQQADPMGAFLSQFGLKL